MKHMNFSLGYATRSVLSILIGTIFITSFLSSSETDDRNISEEISKSLKSYSSKHFSKLFYTSVEFSPVWTTEQSLSGFSVELFELIAQDKTLPEDAGLKVDMKQLAAEALSLDAGMMRVGQRAALELKLSKLYKRYAGFKLYGSIDWKRFKKTLSGLRGKGIFAGWDRYKPQTGPHELLHQVLIEGSLYKAFEKSEPQSYHYIALKRELEKYLKLSQSHAWEKIPYTKVIRAGDMDARLPLIRDRLELLDVNLSCYDEDERYDECMQEAVMAFQERHGLEIDGVIGKKTMRALNLSIDHRIGLIMLNLDRIKWLLPRESTRHIFVNIPAFTLYIEEGGSLLHQMKVITGKRKNPTPVFSDTVESLVLNPSWIVPKSIIQKELIPKLLRDPNAMVKDGINIYAGWGNERQMIGGGVVNWQAFRYSKKLPFRFVQPPGDDNALGKVKFLFPNRFSVYMHDTPTKPLFKRNIRAFSHGCIRLERPMEMLGFFAGINENIDYENAQKRLEGNAGKHIKLETQVPVDVVYLTAWVDYNGVLQFRDDIYGYDKMQLSTLKKW